MAILAALAIASAIVTGISAVVSAVGAGIQHGENLEDAGDFVTRQQDIIDNATEQRDLDVEQIGEQFDLAFGDLAGLTEAQIGDFFTNLGEGTTQFSSGGTDFDLASMDLGTVGNPIVADLIQAQEAAALASTHLSETTQLDIDQAKDTASASIKRINLALDQHLTHIDKSLAQTLEHATESADLAVSQVDEAAEFYGSQAGISADQAVGQVADMADLAISNATNEASVATGGAEDVREASEASILNNSAAEINALQSGNVERLRTIQNEVARDVTNLRTMFQITDQQTFEEMDVRLRGISTNLSNKLSQSFQQTRMGQMAFFDQALSLSREAGRASGSQRQALATSGVRSGSSSDALIAQTEQEYADALASGEEQQLLREQGEELERGAAIDEAGQQADILTTQAENEIERLGMATDQEIADLQAIAADTTREITADEEARIEVITTRAESAVNEGNVRTQAQLDNIIANLESITSSTNLQATQRIKDIRLAAQQRIDSLDFEAEQVEDREDLNLEHTTETATLSAKQAKEGAALTAKLSREEILESRDDLIERRNLALEQGNETIAAELDAEIADLASDLVGAFETQGLSAQQAVDQIQLEFMQNVGTEGDPGMARAILADIVEEIDDSDDFGDYFWAVAGSLLNSLPDVLSAVEGLYEAGVISDGDGEVA